DNSRPWFFDICTAGEAVDDGFFPSPVLGGGELEHRAAALFAIVIATQNCRAVQVAGGVKYQSARRRSAIAATQEFVNYALGPTSVGPKIYFVNSSEKRRAIPADAEPPAGRRAVEVSGSVGNKAA